MKLWQKDSTQISAIVEKFTVGKDRQFDILLAKYDVLGSLAHIAMLTEVGLLPADEHVALKHELEQMLCRILGDRDNSSANLALAEQLSINWCISKAKKNGLTDKCLCK